MATILMLALFTTAGRLGVAAWLRRSRRLGRLRSTVIVRGQLSDVLRFITRIRRDQCRPFEVVAAQITDGAVLGAFDDITIVPASTDPVDAAVRNRATSLAILGPPDLSSDALRRLIWHSESLGVETHIVPIVEPVAAPQIAPGGPAGVPSFSYQGPNRHLQPLKVVMDRLLAAVGLVVLSPLLGGIAILVKVTSQGPILFRQARVGRDGALFTMLKFRTMCENAEQMKADLAELNTHAGGTLFKIRHDPRITPVGRVLRRYSLDELPQLINVARGEMSLVGPRPPLPAEVANYPADSMRRFIVRPGLTGLWQVSGRSDLDPVESARLDTQYVENWSLEMDLRILARTARVIVTGSGAY
jgi:exopolysaccharide biosynthesis polyprenyl glycosylphosphotransferase